jgi:hypothetical protein
MQNRATPDFAQLGTIFNDATTRLVGGVTPTNAHTVLADLQKVQSGLQQLITTLPNPFQGETAIHAQNIVDQLNLEMTAIKSIGSDPYAAKYVNDVHRDVLDIIHADTNLTALATQHGANGFAAVPGLIAPPAPFNGNAEQTAFMTQFAADAQTLGARAVDLSNSGAAPNSAAVTQLIHDVQAFDTSVNHFTVAQGGLYSARFNNEFASDGVNGTASRALIHGLQSANAGEVQAAANVLAANAADVAGNMLGLGATPPPPSGGIPAHIDTFAQAGTVFNDATARLIGGVYDGLNNDGNRKAIVNDLTATKAGLEALGAQHPEQFQGGAAHQLLTIETLLGKEIAAVQGSGTNPHAAATINELHRDILTIVQHSPVLQGAANSGDLTGFTALPASQHGGARGHGADRGQVPGPTEDHSTPAPVDEAHGDHGAAAHVTALAIEHHHMWG